MLWHTADVEEEVSDLARWLQASFSHVFRSANSNVKDSPGRELDYRVWF